MKTTEITITLDDFKTIPTTYEEINALYESNTKCPLATAVKRTGIYENPYVGTDSIVELSTDGIRGRIFPPFYMDDYKNLLNGTIKEFKTTFTPNYNENC